MSKIAALEDMYLIYQNLRDFLTESGDWTDTNLEDLTLAFNSFCQREPIGGMFLESVLEELVGKYKEVDVEDWVVE